MVPKCHLYNMDYLDIGFFYLAYHMKGLKGIFLVGLVPGPSPLYMDSFMDILGLFTLICKIHKGDQMRGRSNRP